ncbi:MAG: helix-turn-helix domain-containing protein [Verrucomicrobia bacterium]|nr:helix-turn-helix domain-containing protein [Deltaproteobacteria bacterium]
MIQKVVSPESLGQALRAERKQKGLSQKVVGHSVGMEQHTISKIEKGNPGTELNTLFRLLAALDLELTVQPRLKPSVESKGDIC